MNRTQFLFDEHQNTDIHTGDNYVDGCPTCFDPIEHYQNEFGWDISLAEARGWDRNAHFIALLDEDIDAISLTHPINWLTEDEVER